MLFSERLLIRALVLTNSCFTFASSRMPAFAAGDAALWRCSPGFGSPTAGYGNDHARHRFRVGQIQHRVDDLLRHIARVVRGEAPGRIDRYRRRQWRVDDGSRHCINLHVMRGEFDGERTRRMVDTPLDQGWNQGWHRHVQRHGSACRNVDDMPLSIPGHVLRSPLQWVNERSQTRIDYVFQLFTPIIYP